MPITIAAQIACVEREIGMREHVYHRRVSEGKMTVNKARDELAAMRAVLATLLATNPNPSGQSRAEASGRLSPEASGPAGLGPGRPMREILLDAMSLHDCGTPELTRDAIKEALEACERPPEGSQDKADAARYRWWQRWWCDGKDDMERINDLEYDSDDQASMNAAIDAEIERDRERPQ